MTLSQCSSTPGRTEGSAFGSVVVLIPAYQPNSSLVQLVQALNLLGAPATVVVDDGSGPSYRPLFDQVAQLPGVTVLRHAVNLGKGSALKTGFNFILCRDESTLGVITADADGQHHVDDILKVYERFDQNPDSLVMGVRSFGPDVPLRSRAGNQITRSILRVLVGRNLSDTQTGLRAIPRELLSNLLKVPSCGYEFELEMLLAVKHLAIPVVEQPIRTIYEPGNPTSHFRPLFDSMRIYVVLLRFSIIAVMTAALDNLLFFLLFTSTGSVLRAQIGARLVAILFNYSAVRKAAFHSQESNSVLLPRYLALVLANTLVSYAGIKLLTGVLPIGVFPAKVIVESLLFAASFAIQRDFVFTRHGTSHAQSSRATTDWDRYYQAVPTTARLTRRYTQSILTAVMRRFAALKRSPDTIVEIGGANSCFLDAILRDVHPAAYHVVDQNQYGLALLEKRVKNRDNVILHQGDVLGLEPLGVAADVVFSVGLIEHFDTAGTRKAISAHFDLLRPGGFAIISFPTPTWLYSAARRVCETLGLWNFPDERPLGREEVVTAMRSLGDIVFEKTLWPLIFTQHLVVARKN